MYFIRVKYRRIYCNYGQMDGWLGFYGILTEHADSGYIITEIY